jgi:hypothetical protein
MDRSISEHESILAETINQKFPFLRAKTSEYTAEILISRITSGIDGPLERFTIPEAEVLSQLDDSTSALSWLDSRAATKRTLSDG